MKKEIRKNLKIDIVNIKENVKKLSTIDRSLIPQYLDNLKEKTNKKPKEAAEDNIFLKYM